MHKSKTVLKWSQRHTLQSTKSDSHVLLNPRPWHKVSCPDSPDPCGYSSSSPGTPSLHRCPGTHSRARPSEACLSSPADSWAGSHFPWTLSRCRGASAVYTPHRAEPTSSVTVSYRRSTHQWTGLFLHCKTVIYHFHIWDKISINPTTRNAQHFLSTLCTENAVPGACAVLPKSSLWNTARPTSGLHPLPLLLPAASSFASSLLIFPSPGSQESPVIPTIAFKKFQTGCGEERLTDGHKAENGILSGKAI